MHNERHYGRGKWRWRQYTINAYYNKRKVRNYKLYKISWTSIVRWPIWSCYNWLSLIDFIIDTYDLKIKLGWTSVQWSWCIFFKKKSKSTNFNKHKRVLESTYSTNRYMVALDFRKYQETRSLSQEEQRIYIVNSANLGNRQFTSVVEFQESRSRHYNPKNSNRIDGFSPRG